MFQKCGSTHSLHSETVKILFYATKHFQLITQEKFKKKKQVLKNIANLIFEVLRVVLLEVRVMQRSWASSSQ